MGVMLLSGRLKGAIKFVSLGGKLNPLKVLGVLKSSISSLYQMPVFRPHTLLPNPRFIVVVRATVLRWLSTTERCDVPATRLGCVW